MKFSIVDLFSKCDQIRRKLRIWSHLLKKSLMENPIFCVVRRLLTNPFGKIYPLTQNQALTLAAWNVSRKVWQQKTFQRGFPDLCQVIEEQAQFLLMNRSNASGLAGVLKGKLIHFDVISISNKIFWEIHTKNDWHIGQLIDKDRPFLCIMVKYREFPLGNHHSL